MLNTTHYIDLSSWQAILFLVGTFLSSSFDAMLEWRNTLGTGLKQRLAALREMHPLAEKLFSNAKVSAAMRYAEDSNNLMSFSDGVTSGIETLILVFGISPLVMGTIFAAFPSIPPMLGIPLSFFLMSLIEKAYDIPFSYLDAFVVEKRHGFNKMSKKLFFRDVAVGTLVSAALSIPLSVAYVFLAERFGDPSILNFTLILAFMATLEPVLDFMNTHVIMPLFNKFTPLENGSLRRRIEDMLARNGMRASSISVMDSSRRTGKVNAFVHGFWRSKRIVLFDELLRKHSEDEILSVVAHEVGHAKLHHIAIGWIMALVTSAITLGIAFFLMNDISIYRAFGYWFVTPENLPSFRYVGFGLSMGLWDAISWVLTPISSWISRRMEYQADEFAVGENGKDPLRTALMKLHSENLSNVAPDSLYESWNCSHPSILPRLKAIGDIYDSKAEFRLAPGRKPPRKRKPPLPKPESATGKRRRRGKRRFRSRNTKKPQK